MIHVLYVYVRGLSTGGLAPALDELLGTKTGWFAPTVSWPTEARRVEHDESPSHWTRWSLTTTSRPSTGSKCARRSRSTPACPRSTSGPRSPRGAEVAQRRARDGIRAGRDGRGPLTQDHRCRVRRGGAARRDLHPQQVTTEERQTDRATDTDGGAVAA